MQHKKYDTSPTSLRHTAQKLASLGLCYAERSDLSPLKWREKARPVLRGTIPVVPKNR